MRKEGERYLSRVRKSSMPKLSWNYEEEFMLREIEPERRGGNFSEFPMENNLCFAFVPTLDLACPCLVSGLFLWGTLAHFRKTFCVRASQKCHCTTGLEICWCLSSESQQMPLFSSRQIQGFIGNLAGLQYGLGLSFQELPEKKCKRLLWQNLVCVGNVFCVHVCLVPIKGGAVSCISAFSEMVWQP